MFNFHYFRDLYQSTHPVDFKLASKTQDCESAEAPHKKPATLGNTQETNLLHKIHSFKRYQICKRSNRICTSTITSSSSQFFIDNFARFQLKQILDEIINFRNIPIVTVFTKLWWRYTNGTHVLPSNTPLADAKCYQPTPPTTYFPFSPFTS